MLTDQCVCVKISLKRLISTKKLLIFTCKSIGTEFSQGVSFKWTHQEVYFLALQCCLHLQPRMLLLGLNYCRIRNNRDCGLTVKKRPPWRRNAQTVFSRDCFPSSDAYVLQYSQVFWELPPLKMRWIWNKEKKKKMNDLSRFKWAFALQC